MHVKQTKYLQQYKHMFTVQRMNNLPVHKCILCMYVYIVDWSTGEQTNCI